MARYYTLLPSRKLYGRSLFQICNIDEVFHNYEVVIKAPNLKTIIPVLMRNTRKDPTTITPGYRSENLIIKERLSTFFFSYGVTCRGKAKQDFFQWNGYNYLVIIPEQSPEVEIFVHASNNKWVNVGQKVLH
jgi:hypothetical protein